MNSSARSHSCARSLVAVVVFAAFSWALLGSVSPQLHARIHADADHAEHVCAIILIASGSYEQVAQPAFVSEPEFLVRFPVSAELISDWVKPVYLEAHIFSHAPPTHS
jgi:hypothetical protein